MPRLENKPMMIRLGVGLAIVGIVTAYNLKDKDPEHNRYELRRLGGLIFTIGLLLMAGGTSLGDWYFKRGMVLRVIVGMMSLVALRLAYNILLGMMLLA